ncbi:MAG: flippase [Candidatus Falkowbacteria bacterium]
MNQPKISNIAKNTSYYTLALIIQKVISFTYFVIIARALGPEDLGKYYFAISFTTVFGILIDLGLANVLTREVAKRPHDAGQLLSANLQLKLPLALLTTAIVYFGINILGYPTETIYLVYISTASMILDSFTLTFFAVSRGFHNLSFESVSSVIFQAIVLTAGLISLKLGYGAIWLMAGLAIASVFNTAYAFYIIKHRLKVPINWRFDAGWIKQAIALTLPFAMFAISQRLYTYSDSVILSKLAGDKEVGLYQVAFKIIFAIQFLPAAFSASLYPAFANYWQHNKEQLAITFERGMKYLAIISLPISVGTIAITEQILHLFKGGFDGAFWPVRICIISLPFLFLNFAVGALLNASDRQKINTRNMLIVTVVSIGLNFLLIPSYKAIGASITNTVTNVLMLALCLWEVPKIISFAAKRFSLDMSKMLVAALAMGIVAFWLRDMLPILLVVVLSGAVYFGLLLSLKVFHLADITSIWQSFTKKAAPTITEEL